MIEELPKEQFKELLPLLDEHQYLTLLLEGLIKEKLGEAFVDDKEKPKVVLLRRKVLAYLAGESDHPAVQELVQNIHPGQLILAPNDHWVQRLQTIFGKKLQPYPRTKFSSDKLDRKKMQKIIKKLPSNYTIQKLTKQTIANISKQAKYIIGILFPTLDDFLEQNFGFYIMDGEKITSLALAASPIYNNKFEIHIETDPEYQRKGLATIACAKLIEYSLNRGLEPHWDADNEPSARLAEKLGFTEGEKYLAYSIHEKKENSE